MQLHSTHGEGSKGTYKPKTLWIWLPVYLQSYQICGNPYIYAIRYICVVYTGVHLSTLYTNWYSSPVESSGNICKIKLRSTTEYTLFPVLNRLGLQWYLSWGAPEAYPYFTPLGDEYPCTGYVCVYMLVYITKTLLPVQLKALKN